MKKNRRKKDKSWEPRFMFTKNEIVQLWEQQGRKGMLVAKLARMRTSLWLWKEARGEKLIIAEVGTVQGETAEAQFTASVASGARLHVDDSVQW